MGTGCLNKLWNIVINYDTLLHVYLISWKYNTLYYRRYTDRYSSLASYQINITV